MKKNTKKGILQKITISILSIMLFFNFIIPTYSNAGIGGVLTDPIFDFVALLGDTIIGLVQGALNVSIGENFSASNNVLMVDVEDFSSSDYDKFKDISNSTIQRTIDTSELNLGWGGDSYQIPLSRLSPEEIFGGQVAALDINFINPDKAKWGTATDAEGDEIAASSSGQLQKTIASWYVALRNLSVVALLSILVYVGIRIILSSTANDKAKYKQMLTDWLIALCLLFFMHYIMSFIVTMTESITTAILGDSNGNIAVTVNSSDGKAPRTTFNTNLMGFARFQIQKNTIIEKFTYLIIYAFLLYYTVMFAWKYLKRMVMMAFLTIIAPLVVLTYPIDKMNDGKAQAFDSWLKEYIFNALLQPFHLIIYYVFVLSAMDLAVNNILYTIVVLWFIPKAEEILRKFFGFDKAPSLGSTMAGLAGGLGLSKLMGGKGGSKGKSGGSSSGDSNKPVRFNKGTDVNDLPEGNDNIREQETENEEKTDNPYEQPNYGEPEEQKTPEEMAEEDPNYMYMHPELFNNSSNQTSQSSQQTPQQEKTNDDENKENEEEKQQDKQKGKIRQYAGNWVNGHGGKKELRKKTLTGVARLGTKTAFTLAGGMGGAILGAAQGKGISGMVAGAYAGGKVGNKVANPVINLGGKAWNEKERVERIIEAKGKENKKAALLGGTALGRELDLAHGNTRYQDAGASREVKTNKDNVQYVREYLTDKNGGKAPTAKEVKAQMNSLDPYIEKGFTDIKDMIRSQKAAQKLGLDDSQAAIIAAIGKKNNITPDRLNDDKKAQADRDNLVYQLQNAGNSKQNAEKRADLAMNYLKEKEGIKNNSKK